MLISPDLEATLPASWARIGTKLGTAQFDELLTELRSRGVYEQVARLVAVSPFFADQLARHGTWVQGQLASVWLDARRWSPDQWRSWVADAVAGSHDEAAFMAALRQLRGREYLRLLWRDFAGLGTLEHTLEDVSAFADAAIRVALEYAHGQLSPLYGVPIGAQSGRPQSLIVVGMGKLGGGELNLSSDIDLVFCFPESGETQGGRRSIANQEFFTKLGQRLIRYLNAVTIDGFVFRVDMRLRPWGDSGALVSNFQALGQYYQREGRGWERYALLKARAITGDRDDQAAFGRLAQDFVYRRYVDFGVLENLREMKGMISAEVRRQGLEGNVKKGDGGIREVEFITQCHQLIHGGRQPALRLRGLVESQEALVNAGFMEASASARLLDAYRWLRRCEHAIQGIEDRQTQELPVADLDRQRVAAIMGCEDWSAMLRVLDQYRGEVAEQFRTLIEPDEGAQEDTRSSSAAPLTEHTLEALGFTDVAGSWSGLQALLVSAAVRSQQEESRTRLEAFLPRLCEAAADTSDPDTALARALPFVAAVSRRSAYLVLLLENPDATAQLLDLFLKSQWIADKLTGRPDLLDELLDSERLTTAPERADIESLARQQLLRIPEDDLEAQMMALGRIKDGVVLRVAASELSGRLPVMKVSDYLTYLAETLLAHAIAVARAELVTRHGEPLGDGVGFAVLGYGKLGGIELSYGSDLDLVFVYRTGKGETAGPRVIDNATFYTRLAQRTVHVLSTRMPSGRLYEVDLRLRPHGDSGLVAVSFEGLEKYQSASAWTWEHQALVRSRPITGDVALMAAMEQMRHDVLARPREAEDLARDVANMRRRMLRDSSARLKAPEGYFDLKHDPGGIVDIEFVVQYAVLAHAHRLPQLTQWSDVVRILESLEASAVMPVDEASALRQSYLDYRSAVHGAALSGTTGLGKVCDFREHLDRVASIRDRWLPGASE